MELELKNDNNLELDDFCNWLILEMRKYMSSSLDYGKLIPFNNYINDSDINAIKWNDKDKAYTISVRELTLWAFDYMVVKKEGNDYIIKFDNNALIPDTSTKIIDIIKLINYGNLTLFAYPIFDEMTDFFALNIDSYLDKYIKGIK